MSGTSHIIIMGKMLPPVLLLLLYLIFPRLSQAENSCEAPNRSCLRVAILIPARAGSKGIKDKNLSKLGNETLLSRTLRIVNACGKFDSVWVSTDGEAIAKEATKQVANVHWRDPVTGTDNASTVSVVEDFLNHHEECDIIGVIQCTSPFIKEEFLSRALDLMIKTDAACVFSVIRSRQLRWIENDEFGPEEIKRRLQILLEPKWKFSRSLSPASLPDNSVTPLNFNPRKRPRRQDWKGELIENGMFYFAKKELVLKERVLQNDRCRTVEIPKRFSLEIDTSFDLMQARALLPLFENH